MNAWRVVAVVAALALAAAVGYGTRGSLGLFIHPWQEEFSATRASVSLVGAASFVSLAVSQAVAGKLLEVWPPRLILTGGLVLAGAGFAASSYANDVWAAAALAGATAAFGGGLASLSALSYVATEVVERRPGTVFGILTAGGAAGPIFVLPLASDLLEVSLRASLFGLGVLLAVAALAVAVSLPNVPARTHATAVARPTRLLADRGFWLLLVPFFVCGYTTTGLVDVHLIPHALDHHIDQQVASAALATLAAFNAVGVLAAGAVTDRADRGTMLALIYLARAGTLFVLPLLTSPRAIFLFAVLFGLADFASVPPTTSLARSLFDVGWGFAIGLISAAHQLGSALGAYLGGWFFDHTGSYALSFASAGGALIVAAVMSYALREPASAR